MGFRYFQACSGTRVQPECMEPSPANHRSSPAAAGFDLSEDVDREINARQQWFELHAGKAAINPRGVWHTADGTRRSLSIT